MFSQAIKAERSTHLAELTASQRDWSAAQWAEHLKDLPLEALPVLPYTRRSMEEIDAGSSNYARSISPRDVSAMLYNDPYLALKMLRKAEARRVRRLGREITTPLSTVLQAGIDDVIKEALRSRRDGRESGAVEPGLQECEARALMASKIAFDWAVSRIDILPDEVAMAALLSESGELVLWHCARAIPKRAYEESLLKPEVMPARIQKIMFGFTFKEMTLALADAWKLPHLISLLIRGTDTLRANVARLAAETARHIVSNPRHPALIGDINCISHLLPCTGVERLVAALPVPADYKDYILHHVVHKGTRSFHPGPRA